MTDPLESWAAAAAFLGADYDRYSFTKGTAQEAAFVTDVLSLGPSTTVLDVGCGTGRHLAALRHEGVPVVGVDIAEGFVRVVPGPAAVGDARRLPVRDRSVDAVLGLCEGGIGLVGAGDDGDASVLREVARVLRPGGVAAMTVFAAHFAVRHLEAGETFDPATGGLLETTELQTSAGERRPFRLASTAYTPRELSLLFAAAGLEPVDIWSVAPGDYARREPDLDHPELLGIARKPVG